MNDKITIHLELEKIKSKAGGDVGNIECDFCDKHCQRVGETWYECYVGQVVLFFCPDCVKKLKVA